MNYDIFKFWKGHDPNKIVFEQDGNETTYNDLAENIEKRIAIFEQIGIEKQNHVVISINDQQVYMEVFLALWSLNVTIIPIDFQISSSNFWKIIKESDANYIISNSIRNYAALEGAESKYHNLKKIVLLRDNKIEVTDVNCDTNKTSWLTEQKFPEVAGFFMLFTSGTSGECKGIVLKKKSFLNNVRKVITYTQLQDSDILLMNLPLSYSFALSQVCAHLMMGGKIILSVNNVYNSLTLLEIKEKNVTNYPATPYFYETLVKEFQTKKEEIDIGNLRFFMSAGGYINPFVIEEIVKKFPSVIFYNNYGQTEASPRISYNRIDITNTDFKGAGRPLTGVEIKIFGEDRVEVEDNNIGEIWYKSEDLMLGYYRKNILNPEQYFMSGDLGYIDNNNLVIVGRNDSILKINGRKVYKNYIENSIYELPYVSNVKLKKEKHNIYGEYFCAYVVPKDYEDNKTIIDKIYEFCKKNFNAYERPKKIVICKEISLSSNKKVTFKTATEDIGEIARR
ncbi:acyl--CoA ligase [Clostridium sp. CF011]|uniref:class I adenylate-forming enzyme family protein n=1 Tax=Clostridium sp. CF011 TaxID=2843318 RepID=UPI001C0B6BCB|nr:class I adenylate-forming enzyme family protein [Clostridium sp. CF011]MBU3093578.1 acyl--CoA ligase [Clostridium sp. CF011]WAG71699.1 acyl--CoA ligase [Clostridium sp. CF011]